jgi:hypothetical protein
MPRLPLTIALLNDRVVFLTMSWQAIALLRFIAAIWLGVRFL